MKKNEIEVGMKVKWENDPYIVKTLGEHYITLVNRCGSRFSVGYNNVSKMKRMQGEQFTIRELTRVI